MPLFTVVPGHLCATVLYTAAYAESAIRSIDHIYAAQGGHGSLEHIGYLPLSLGELGAFKTMFYVHHVEPAGAWPQSAQGIIFVADAAPSRASANAPALARTKARVEQLGLIWRELSVVVQLENAEVAGALTSDEVREQLQLGDDRIIAADSASGNGIMSVIKAVAKPIFAEMKRFASSQHEAPVKVDRFALPQPEHFLSRFCALAGNSVNLELVPSCALRLVHAPAIHNLLVVTDAGSRTIIDATSQEPCDPATQRFTRALWAAFYLSFGDAVERWEQTWFPLLRDAAQKALGLSAVDPIWTALAVFRCAARGGAGRYPDFREVFLDQAERKLVLELQLCLETPDRETFAHGTAAVLIDEFELSDDEVRSALDAIWPGSDVWDDHLRELASSEG